MLPQIRARIQDRPTLKRLMEQIDSLEINAGSDAVFDIYRAILETICKLVIADRQSSDEDISASDLPPLSKKAINLLSSKISGVEFEPIKKISKGLVNAVQGVCELRTNWGEFSHGKEVLREKSLPAFRSYVESATDLIGSFLLDLHFGIYDLCDIQRIHYENHEDFNNWFDEIHDLIVVGDYKFHASRVLFDSDNTAYREELLSYTNNQKDDDSLET